MEPYYSKNNVWLYHSNCVDFMESMPENVIDLTVTSPPYDNLRKYKDGSGDNWGEDVWKKVIEGLWKVTKPGGIIVWIVGDATVKGSETGTSFKQALYFKEVGFNLHDTMIYSKSSQSRQNGYRYEQQFEYMFVLSKGATKIRNPIKEQSKHAGKIVKRTCRDGGKDSLSSSNNIVGDEKIKGNVWYYGTKTNKNGHPAIFPEKLAKDHIVSWSNEGDLVFDPFSGSGTTAKMAIETNRIFVGSEISKEYIDLSIERLESK